MSRRSELQEKNFGSKVDSTKERRLSSFDPLVSDGGRIPAMSSRRASITRYSAKVLLLAGGCIVSNEHTSTEGESKSNPFPGINVKYDNDAAPIY